MARPHFQVVVRNVAIICCNLQLYNSFPLLMRHFPGPHQSLLQMWNNVKDFIRAELDEHKKKWDPSDCRDYIDCYLNEIQKVSGFIKLNCQSVCVRNRFMLYVLCC